MDLQGITRVTSDVQRAKKFYEEILGFEPGPYYEPTRWQAYQCPGGAFYAIGEAPGSTNEVGFVLADIEAFWEKVKDQVEVVEPLARTPWGTSRFVIKDPDGHLLAFGQK